LEDIYEKYVEALIQEISSFSINENNLLPIHSIFFGGGTPSLLPSEAIHKILGAIQKHFIQSSDIEISFEANPGTLSQSFLKELKEFGVNRLSIGMQSANPTELVLLERNHSFENVIESVRMARIAGFENINLDLIFSLPGQSVQTWTNNLELAIDLEPEHLALYALSFEHDTPFTKMLEQGLFQLPESDMAADMYHAAEDILGKAGYDHYEISSWAKKKDGFSDFSCRHNMQYWRNNPYFGFGAGAHGWVNQVRTVNVLSPRAYIQRSGRLEKYGYPSTFATVTSEEISIKQEMSETMMMGLRLLKDGISPEDFDLRFGKKLTEVYSLQIDDLDKRGLLDLPNSNQPNLRLTQRARLLGNQAFQEFV
jgi:oxygen-independent coproporphyrinogen-3 oxidase